MMRSWTRRNGSNPLGSLSLHPRCGKIRADVNRQIIQNSAYGRGRCAFEILFGSGSAGLGNIGDRYWSGVLPVPDEPCKVMTGRLPQIEPRRSLAQCDLARMRRDAEEVGAGLAEVVFTAPEHYDHPCNWLGQAQS